MRVSSQYEVVVHICHMIEVKHWVINTSRVKSNIKFDQVPRPGVAVVDYSQTDRQTDNQHDYILTRSEKQQINLAWPHFDYYDIYGVCSKQNVDMLQKLQSQAACIISGSRQWAYRKDIYKQCGWLSVEIGRFYISGEHNKYIHYHNTRTVYIE